jgi:hypothetical protein
MKLYWQMDGSMGVSKPTEMTIRDLLQQLSCTLVGDGQ